MFSGIIEGVGARYCPSIEDKVNRFADKERHQFFLEPESLNTKELYVQGLSTSMPAKIQDEFYRSISGFENVKIMRNAYAIEYDCIDPLQIKPSLESRMIEGLFFAGQVNGTSGYEEAAAQGLMAGINASLKLRGKNPIILKRNEAYIGVLIDDLVTKGTNEPYRMMTSRAEYRLILRQDNADIRLTKIGRDAGLVSAKRYNLFQNKTKQLEDAFDQCRTVISPKNLGFLTKYGENVAKTGLSVRELIKRNTLDASIIKKELGFFEGLSENILKYITTEIKYDGYLDKQEIQIKQMLKAEEMLLPEDCDYSNFKGLRLEARQKLNKYKPSSIGQASRISGISPADIQLLTIYFASPKMNPTKRS